MKTIRFNSLAAVFAVLMSVNSVHAQAAATTDAAKATKKAAAANPNNNFRGHCTDPAKGDGKQLYCGYASPLGCYKIQNEYPDVETGLTCAKNPSAKGCEPCPDKISACERDGTLYINVNPAKLNISPWGAGVNCVSEGGTKLQAQEKNFLQTLPKGNTEGRRGSVTNNSSENPSSSSNAGIGDMLGGLMGGSEGGIGVKAKGTLREPQAHDINMGSGEGSRSKEEITKVVNARMSGLRNIYVQFLKKNPGFSGKVTTRFTITPNGDVINVSLVSSTTNYAAFDNAIKDEVATWKWKAIKSGNTTPTIPFNFE